MVMAGFYRKELKSVISNLYLGYKCSKINFGNTLIQIEMFLEQIFKL